MKIKQKLNELGFRATPTRVAVINFFENAKTPKDIGEILAHLKTIDLFADQATIYRIVNSFVGKNILRKVEFKEGRARYELASLPHHHHVICNSCGEIDDVSFDHENIIKTASKQSNFMIKDHSLEFFGICQSCQ